MTDIIRLKSVRQALEFMGLGKPAHPLVSVFRHSREMRASYSQSAVVGDLYFVSLKDNISGSFAYGRGSYDFEEGTMVFVAPGQSIVPPGYVEPDDKGWSLVFHPDLLLRSPLAGSIGGYSFFGYELNEALHVSTKERANLSHLIQQVEAEIQSNMDQHSHELMLSNIELLLKYCARYYDRQFYTRHAVSGITIDRFKHLLREYFASDRQLHSGIPSVKYCAEQLHLSPNYLSDLLKKETGSSAQDHIHHHVIERAKVILAASSEPVSSVAYSLGFDYSQHFSKLFKAKTGLTPTEFKKLH